MDIYQRDGCCPGMPYMFIIRGTPFSIKKGHKNMLWSSLVYISLDPVGYKTFGTFNLYIILSITI